MGVDRTQSENGRRHSAGSGFARSLRMQLANSRIDEEEEEDDGDDEGGSNGDGAGDGALSGANRG